MCVGFVPLPTPRLGWVCESVLKVDAIHCLARLIISYFLFILMYRSFTLLLQLSPPPTHTHCHSSSSFSFYIFNTCTNIWMQVLSSLFPTFALHLVVRWVIASFSFQLKLKWQLQTRAGPGGEGSSWAIIILGCCFWEEFQQNTSLPSLRPLQHLLPHICGRILHLN